MKNSSQIYLEILTTKYRKTFARFRTSNHHLLIETGRSLGILINEKRCTFYNSRQKADKMRFVLECEAFSDVRNEYL